MGNALGLAKIGAFSHQYRHRDPRQPGTLIAPASSGMNHHEHIA
jgi:hypothetical protein